MILSNKLFEGVLIADADKCNTLKIISGFATSSMATRHLEVLKEKSLNLKIELIVGMTPCVGIGEADHKLFQEIMQKAENNFKCSYVSHDFKHIHSKLYVWCKDNIPIKAYTGSANYTQNAFFTKQGEIITACDPVSSLEYYNTISANSIYCTHQEGDSYITKKSVLCLMAERPNRI